MARVGGSRGSWDLFCFWRGGGFQGKGVGDGERGSGRNVGGVVSWYRIGATERAELGMWGRCTIQKSLPSVMEGTSTYSTTRVNNPSRFWYCCYFLKKNMERRKTRVKINYTSDSASAEPRGLLPAICNERSDSPSGWKVMPQQTEKYRFLWNERAAEPEPSSTAEIKWQSRRFVENRFQLIELNLDGVPR